MHDNERSASVGSVIHASKTFHGNFEYPMLCLRRDHLPPSLLSEKERDREREKGKWKEKRKQEGGNKEKDQREEEREREGEVNSRKFSHCLRTWKSFVAISWKMTIDSSSYLAVELHLQRAFNVNNCPLYTRITKTQGTGWTCL